MLSSVFFYFVNLMGINERLKRLRVEFLGLTQPVFAERIGLKTASIVQMMESGTRSVTDRTIKAVCEEFNVSEKWLRENEGDAFFTPLVSEKPANYGPHGGWKPRNIEEMAGVPEGLGMGRAVEMLARIYNSKKQSVIRAIYANLQVFSERIDMEDEIISLRREMSELRELVKQHAKTHAYYGEDRRSGSDRRQVDGLSPTGEERRSGVDRRQPMGGNHGAEK